MTKDYSPVSKIFYIVILCIVAYFMMSLSYGWSLDQTMILTGAITGMEYASTGAWLIQLSPQALLAIAGIAMLKKQRNLSIALISSALLVNALDAYTNIVAFQELWPIHSAQLAKMGRSAEFINAAKTVGYGVAFLVTWFEEGVMLCIGTALILFGELGEEMGWNLPPFFRAFSAVTSGMGFNFSQANQMATRPQSNRGNNSHGNDGNNGSQNQNQRYQRPSRVRN